MSTDASAGDAPALIGLINIAGYRPAPWHPSPHLLEHRLEGGHLPVVSFETRPPIRGGQL